MQICTNYYNYQVLQAAATRAFPSRSPSPPVTAGSLVGRRTGRDGWVAVHPSKKSTYLAGLLYLSTIVLCTKLALNLN